MGTGFFVHHRIVSADKRVEFVSDRMSYIVLRGRMRWTEHVARMGERRLGGET